MVSLQCTPLTFLLAGFTWLVLFSLVGVATLLGLVYGTPLPTWVRTVHVHGILIGGLLQLMVGGVLASIALQGSQASLESRPWLFLFFNGATLALLACLGLKQYPLAGATGLLLAVVVASLAKPAWRHVKEQFVGPASAVWVYGGSFSALFIGLLIGSGMAFQPLTEYYPHARLLHLHLIVLGFFTQVMLTFIPYFLPLVLRCELVNPKIGKLTTGLLFAGFAALLGGFITSSLRFELAIGSFLLGSLGLYAANLFRTWIASESAGNAAAEHLLIAIVFLMLAAATGILMGVNFLRDPPIFPIGSLHIVAYTHLAFIGFMINAVCGALTYALPVFLATSRVPSSRKRGPYQERLNTVMASWRTVQLVGISFGSMGLAVVAALTWSLPLGSLSVRISTWISIGLLLIGLILFSAKLAWISGLHPARSSS